ncbi:hypothetical protein Tcan_03338 [Toxocara canis]|uniref:Uncharacterized protein n=1 Tax=Toxocara canis TaxID=6265 RepID=A0A0B2UQY7_TOXCA|nr:hypothetical protein Tcan_03338 [Toxocara canis]
MLKKLLTILLIAKGCSALECYAGQLSFGYMGVAGGFELIRCGFGSQFCFKRVFQDQYRGGRVIEKSCDISGQCYTTGNGCYYNPDSATEFCCCASNYCNGSTTSCLSIILMIFLSFIVFVRVF